MTIWHGEEERQLEYELEKRLGKDVFSFLYDKINRDYLTDHFCLSSNIKKDAEGLVLSDYSPFVLHICKFFENSLNMIAERMGLLRRFPPDRNLDGWFSITGYFNKNRQGIENLINAKISSQRNAKRTIDKLYSTVNDMDERNKIAHPGKLLNYNEIANFEGIIGKLKELIDILSKHKLINLTPKRKKAKWRKISITTGYRAIDNYVNYKVTKNLKFCFNVELADKKQYFRAYFYFVGENNIEGWIGFTNEPNVDYCIPNENTQSINEPPAIEFSIKSNIIKTVNQRPPFMEIVPKRIKIVRFRGDKKNPAAILFSYKFLQK